MDDRQAQLLVSSDAYSSRLPGGGDVEQGAGADRHRNLRCLSMARLMVLRLLKCRDGITVTTDILTWSDVRRIVLAEGSLVGGACADAVRSVIPDDVTRDVEVGFPGAVELLDAYRYRYRYRNIEEFRKNRIGWTEFFSH